MLSLSAAQIKKLSSESRFQSKFLNKKLVNISKKAEYLELAKLKKN